MIFIIKGFRTIVFIFIVISTTFRPKCPSSHFQMEYLKFIHSFGTKSSSRLSGFVHWCRLTTLRSSPKMGADFSVRLHITLASGELSLFCFLSRTHFNNFPFDFVSANHCSSGRLLLINSIFSLGIQSAISRPGFSIIVFIAFLSLPLTLIMPLSLSLSLSLSLLLLWIPSPARNHLLLK